MADNNGSDWAFTLPVNQPSPGEVQQQGIAMTARNGDRQAGLMQQIMEQQRMAERQHQQSRVKNLSQIDEDANPSQYVTGEQAFDNYSISELNKIKENAIANYVDLDPVEAKYRLMKDMDGFVKWHTSAKTAIKGLNAGLQDFNKTLPNANAIKAHGTAFDMLANDYMVNENGQWKRKPIELIQPKDYVSELYKPEVLGTLVDDTTPFDNKLHSLEKFNLSDSDFESNKGFSKKTKWSAVGTPYTDITPNKQGLPEIDVKHTTIEGVKDADGKPMKFVSDDIIKDLQGDPKAWAAVLGMWSKEKGNVEARLGRKIDKSEEDYRFKNYLYKQIKNKVPQGTKTEQATVIPKPRIVVNNYGATGKNALSRDAYSEVYDAVPEGKDIALGDMEIPMDVKNIIMGQVRKQDDLASPAEIHLTRAGDKLKVTQKLSDGRTVNLGTTDFLGVNLDANKPLGMGAKKDVLNKSQKTKKPSKKDDPLGIL